MNYHQLFQHAFLHRNKLITDEQNTCFRLFHGDGEGAPGLTLDYYDGAVLLQYFQEEHLEKIDLIVEALYESAATKLAISSLYAKNRMTVSDTAVVSEERMSTLVRGAEVSERIPVLHNGMKLYADVIHAQNTGIFMDMRQVRERLLSIYPELSSVLNLFCYTGAFSIHALQNGSNYAVNVDVSAPVLERARENYVLNSLSCDDRDFIRGDAIKVLRLLAKKGRTFDLVIFDPPTFSRSKKSYFSVKKDYMKYCRAIEELQPKYVLSAMNTYSVTVQQYLASHPSTWKREFLMHEASDFPHGGNPYLKCGLWSL